MRGGCIYFDKERDVCLLDSQRVERDQERVRFLQRVIDLEHEEGIRKEEYEKAFRTCEKKDAFLYALRVFLKSGTIGESDGWWVRHIESMLKEYGV